MKVLAYYPTSAGDPDEYTDQNPFNLHPVERDVDNLEPARGLLNELLKGPTRIENAAGSLPLDTRKLAAEDVVIKLGECAVSFRQLVGRGSFISELSQICFEEAVSLSLKQFTTVKSISISYVSGI
jgi:hypothetical protein